MKTRAQTYALVLILVPAAVACTTQVGGSGDPTSGSGSAPGAVGAGGGAGGGPGGAPVAEAECNDFFDALQARASRCGGSPLGMDGFETARKGALEVCRRRSGMTGSGYTSAFYARCTETLKRVECADVTALINDCWEPHGQLKSGQACSADHQCTTGYCDLPERAPAGSACGVCGDPVLLREHDDCSIENAKCRPGLRCHKNGKGEQFCVKPTSTGLYGRGVVDTSCKFDYDCVYGTVCTADFPGHTGGTENRRCRPLSGLGERYTYNYTCDSWLYRAPNGLCEVEEVLSCK